jgi:predicted transcriptional regulator
MGLTMANDKEKVRLSLDLSPQVNATLEGLAEKLGGTKSDVLRKAIALMEVAVDARERGQQLGIANRDQLLTTIIHL